MKYIIALFLLGLLAYLVHETGREIIALIKQAFNKR